MVRKQKKRVKMQMLWGGETEVVLSNKFGDKAEKNKYRRSSCGNFKSMRYDDPVKEQHEHAKCDRCKMNKSESSKMCFAPRNPPKPKMTFAKEIKKRMENKERTVLQPNPKFER